MNPSGKVCLAKITEYLGIINWKVSWARLANSIHNSIFLNNLNAYLKKNLFPIAYILFFSFLFFH